MQCCASTTSRDLRWCPVRAGERVLQEGPGAPHPHAHRRAPAEADAGTDGQEGRSGAAAAQPRGGVRACAAGTPPSTGCVASAHSDTTCLTSRKSSVGTAGAAMVMRGPARLLVVDSSKRPTPAFFVCSPSSSVIVHRIIQASIRIVHAKDTSLSLEATPAVAAICEVRVVQPAATHSGCVCPLQATSQIPFDMQRYWADMTSVPSRGSIKPP